MTNEINMIIGGFDDGRTPNVQQYDVGSRMFLCRLWEKPGVAYQMAENAFVGVVFEWRRAKPTGEYETKVIDHSTVLVTVPGAATQIAGAVKMQLVIHQAGGQLYGPKITFMALESLKASDVEPEEPKLLLETLIEKTQKAADRVDQMQIDASGLAGDSNKLGGQAPEYYLTQVNLLDNSNFRNPVNKRGFVSTNQTDEAYGLDRWLMSVNDGGSITLVDDGLECVNANLIQRIESTRMDSSKQYTMGICFDDGSTKIATYWVDINIAPGINRVIFYNITGTVTGLWLYEGVFTYETLPPYVPKPYDVELAECQYYANVIEISAYGRAGFCKTTQGEQTAVWMPATPPMRPGGIPSVSILEGAIDSFKIEFNQLVATGMSGFGCQSGNHHNILVNLSGNATASVVEPFMNRTGNNVKILISRDM